MISEYGHLLDPNASADSAPPLRVPASTSPEQVAGAIDQFLADHPDDDVVVLVVGGRQIGAVSRERLASRYGKASTVRQGEGERASLHNGAEPTRYEILTLRCQQCGAVAHQVFYDEYNRPPCHVDRAHGLMKLD